MELLPIEADESKNSVFLQNEDCREVLQVYPGFYRRVGFYPPWIGYFARAGNDLVGCGGFKGKPREGKVEIAYGTFRNYQGKGIGTEICRQLISLSLKADPHVRITARTLPEENASTRILRRNAFAFRGMVWDDEDGDVWEWEFTG